MPLITCPQCQEQVEIEAAWYGRKVACPECDCRFTARRPDDAEPDEYRTVDSPGDGPRTRSRRREDYEEDDRPRRRSRRRNEGMAPRNRNLVVILSVLGVFGLGCLGCGGWGVYKFLTPINYSGPWVTQALPDGSCSMDFPRMPKTEDLSDPLSDVAGTKYLLEEVWPPDAAFAFGYIDAPAHTPGLFDEAYQAELTELKQATGAKVVREADTFVAGYPCKEAEFASGNSRGVYRLVYIADRGRPRMLVMFAGGRNVSEADRKKFLDSFRMLR